MKVLFVDDEKQVLRGIERMLDAADFEWEVEFADSGEEALKLIAADEEIGTVVTDMKMPGMDGAQLLQHVSQSHPKIVRIVLSGQAGKEAVFRAVNPMHQYLSKPCDANLLRSTILRASALLDLLHSDALAEVVGGISSLPSVPSVYREVVAELQKEGSSMESIGEIISQDAAMTAKILQLSNSAVLGLKIPVTSAARAAMLLGTETIKSLVLTVGVFQEFEGTGIRSFSIDALMDHCLDVARVSKKIATAEGLDKESIDAAFTAGILHDVGKLVLLSADPDGFAETIKMSTQNNIGSWEAERKVFGTDHAAVGAHMLSIWGIPQTIIEVVALHHSPRKSGEERLSCLTAVAAANELAFLDKNPESERTQVFMDHLTHIGCSERFESWKKLTPREPG